MNSTSWLELAYRIFNINASTGKHNEKGLLRNGDKLGWFPPPLPPTSKHKATLNNHLSLRLGQSQ